MQLVLVEFSFLHRRAKTKQQNQATGPRKDIAMDLRNRAKDRQGRAFYKTVALIAAPIILQSVFTIGVNMMDTMMLGRYGEVQLSGSSLANEFIHIFQILCMGIGGGAAVLTAQYWGAGDIKALRRTITIMLRFCIMIALGFTLATIAWPAQIMRLFTPEADVIEKGVLYLRISAFTYLFFGVMQTMSIVLRSVRLMRIPLMVSISAFFVNVFFNWVFIYGNLGAPEMQIEGAALATLISRVFEFSFVMVYVLVIDRRISYRVRDFFRPCGEQVRVFFRYSLPVIFSDSLLAVGNSVVAVIGGHIGMVFVSANAIISQIVRLSTVFNQGISQASSIIVGNTLGEGDRKKTYQRGRTLIRLSLAAGIFAGIVVLVLSPPIVRFFNVTQETVRVAGQLSYSVAIMVVFQALQSVLTKGVLRGGGDTLFLVVADVVFLWLASIPLGYLAGLVLKVPPFWVYMALKIDYILKTLLCLYRFKTKKWIRRVAASQPILPD